MPLKDTIKQYKISKYTSVLIYRMSSDFKTQLIKDDRLVMNDQVIVNVNKGARQSTSAVFNATSANANGVCRSFK